MGIGWFKEHRKTDQGRGLHGRGSAVRGQDHPGAEELEHHGEGSSGGGGEVQAMEFRGRRLLTGMHVWFGPCYMFKTTRTSTKIMVPRSGAHLPSTSASPAPAQHSPAASSFK